MSLACGVSHFMSLLRLVNLTWREACSTFPSVPSVRLLGTFRKLDPKQIRYGLDRYYANEHDENFVRLLKKPFGKLEE